MRYFCTMRILPAVLGALVLLGFGCSRSVDKVPNRLYHRTTAQFNVLFNGREALLEAQRQAEKNHKDAVDEWLPVYPGRTKAAQQAMETAARRAIEKAGKAIKEHSMMVGGRQKNTAVFEAYLLMGDAYGASGQPYKAMEAYGQVLRNASKSKAAQKAKWATARLYAEQGNAMAAANLLEELERDPELIRPLKPHVHAVWSMVHLKEKRLEEAVEALLKAAEGVPPATSARWYFLAGQLAQKNEDLDQASRAYRKCARGTPEEYALVVEATLRAAMLESGGLSEAKRIASLKKLAKENKNAQYRGQVYYAIAQIYLQAGKRDQAYEAFGQSVSMSIAQPEQKGLSHAARGQMYFEDKAYPKAQLDVDSAVLLLPEEHRLKTEWAKRRTALNRLVAELNYAELQDSLLRLSEWSNTELQAFFTQYVGQLRLADAKRQEQKRKADEIARMNAERGALLADAGPTAGGGGNAWLFYNPQIRAASLATFTRQWGDRPDADNWKWKSASSGFSDNTGESSESEEGLASNEPTGEERYNAEAYLSQVPKTEASKDTVRSLLRKSKVRLGAIYRDEVGDLEEAITVYQNWVTTYGQKGHPEEPLVWFALHRMYAQNKQPLRSEEAKNTLVQRFPTHPVARMALGEKVDPVEQEDPSVVAYQKALEAFVAGNAQEALRLLPQTKALGAKTALLNALCVGKIEGEKAYISALKTVVASHPNTPEAAQAENYLMALGESSK
jgi:tetratricopeptide (TPR) repeat protein